MYLNNRAIIYVWYPYLAMTFMATKTSCWKCHSSAETADIMGYYLHQVMWSCITGAEIGFCVPQQSMVAYLPSSVKEGDTTYLGDIKKWVRSKV